MGKIVYYPAMFFGDIVGYYGNSPSHLEEVIRYNIAQEKRGKLLELKNEVGNLQTTKSKKAGNDNNKDGTGLLNELNNIKKMRTDQRKINHLDKVITMAKAMAKINIDIMEQVLSCIQTLSEEKEGRNGYSDTNIVRFMDIENTGLEEKNYNDIVKYLIEPQEQGDYRALTEQLLDCMKESKYDNLPEDKRKYIQEYLCVSNFKSIYILRIFRTLQKCSIGVVNETDRKNGEGIPVAFEDEMNISVKIEGALTNIWGEAEAEGVGISQIEKKQIIFLATNDLVEDYKFYTSLKCKVDPESSKGFQALMFYRLYNHIYYYRKRNLLNSGISEDLNKALAFFAFSILQRAIEHTGILLHPAAQISAPVYIGDKVMVGKQCKLEAECILKRNVCLYPFNIYNNDVRNKDIYIHIGKGTVFNEDVKVVGSIRVGEHCIVNKSILIGSSIDKNMRIDNDGMSKLES